MQEFPVSDGYLIGAPLTSVRATACSTRPQGRNSGTPIVRKPRQLPLVASRRKDRPQSIPSIGFYEKFTPCF
jgi:hypothetical protein